MWVIRSLGRALAPAGLAASIVAPKLRVPLAERLGLVPRLDGPLRIWLHGASAGDVSALAPLAAELARAAPEAELFVSAVTRSGRDLARRLPYRASALPLDAPGPMGRALGRVRPHVLVLELAELWPNLLDAARRAQVPVVLHNGRISPRRLAHHRALLGVAGPLLADLALLLVQTPGDGERAIALGAWPERVVVAGNTKHDHSLAPPEPAAVAALGAFLGPGGPLIVAGSTHVGEESLLGRALLSVLPRVPDARLLVAPRYVERADEVARALAGLGLPVARRSRAARAGRVAVLDTMGELKAAYAHAAVAFVGGTLVDRGGQNLFEPAALAKPVVHGPSLHHFELERAALLGHGSVEVDSEAALTRALTRLLEEPAEATRLGAEAARRAHARGPVAPANARRILEVALGHEQSAEISSPRAF